MKRLVLSPMDGKLRITFFIRPGLDNFISPQIDALSPYYHTRKVLVSDFGVLEREMEESDICWFEWCDELAVAGSRQPLAQKRIMICRLHSYEIFTHCIHLMNWQVIDQTIFDASHIRDYVLERVPALHESHTSIIPVGLDMAKYTFADRKPGFHIAYVGYINHKKGPMLLLHAFKAIHDRDPRYKLFIAGTHQEARFQLYLHHMVKELNLSDSVQFDGWQANLDGYLEDKDYVLVTSPLESQHVSVMEGMAKGIKPLIHHFWGATALYEHDFLWSSIDQLVERVVEEEYTSSRYRSYIEEHYALTDQTAKLQTLMQQMVAEASRTVVSDPSLPKITVGIINYNYENYLEQCILSVVNQTYPNIEILLSDDVSTDNSMEIIRRYVDEYDFIRFIGDGVHRGTPDYATRKLFQEASGDFLMVLGPDDYLPHDRVLERYIEAFSAPGGEQVDYVYGNYTIVGPTGIPAEKWKYDPLTDREVIWRVFHRFGSGVIPMSGLFRTAYHREEGAWRIEEQNVVAGDTLNGLANIKRGWVRRYVDEPLLCHRRHNKNMTFNSIDDRIQSLLQLLEYIVDHFDESWYLPAIQWKQLEGNGKLAMKHYAVGEHYARMALHYQVSSFTRTLDPEQKKACVQPILERMEHHFARSLEAGEECRAAILQCRNNVGSLLPVPSDAQ